VDMVKKREMPSCKPVRMETKPCMLQHFWLCTTQVAVNSYAEPLAQPPQPSRQRPSVRAARKSPCDRSPRTGCCHVGTLQVRLPKHHAHEVNAFLLNATGHLVGHRRLYCPSQISRAEDRLGLNSKVGSITAIQASWHITFSSGGCIGICPTRTEFLTSTAQT
jgi:hypothetical protein